MNNVYIGERYVPKPDGAYDPTKTYEPLIIVTYGNNTYTSKKYVPAGTLPTDTDYWLPTGNYNGYIAQLQSDVSDVQNEVSDIRSGKRNVIYIGDSYMYGPGTLTQSINARLKINWSHNFSYGGTGFIRDTGGKNFLHQLENAAASLYFDNDDVTDIIMAGGINDDNDNAASAYASAIADIKSYINTNFKNARVWIIPMLWGTSGFTLAESRKYQRLFEGLITSGYAIFPYAFQILMGLDSNTYMLDGSHPNATGCDLIADYICSWIEGGISLPSRKIEGQAILPEGNSNIGYNAVLRDGFLYFHCMLYLRDYTYSAGDTIYTMPDWFISNAGTKFPTTILVDAGSYSGSIYVENGEMKCSDSLTNCNIFVDLTVPFDHLY